jgi:hypothetical protein
MYSLKPVSLAVLVVHQACIAYNRMAETEVRRSLQSLKKDISASPIFLQRITLYSTEYALNPMTQSPCNGLKGKKNTIAETIENNLRRRSPRKG